MSAPRVSVVMGVRNGEHAIASSLASALAQRGVSLECVVVDDGSSDATARLVDDVARRDARVRLLRQHHQGLTRALMHGCDAARGAHIARLDCGDIMMPGRLARQHATLEADPGVALVASAYRLCGPEGEHLSDRHIAGEAVDLTARMTDAGTPSLTGIAHPTVMFRAEGYRVVGGYRPQFALAQDVDLWARLASTGRVLRLGEPLTEIRLTLDALTPRHHRNQQRLRRLAEAAARARREHGDDAGALARAASVSARAMRTAGRRDDWRAAYFVASCLRDKGDPLRARRYYREAAARSPLALRPRLQLALMALRGG